MRTQRAHTSGGYDSGVAGTGGSTAEPPDASGETDPEPVVACAATTERRVRRITQGEYQRIVADLVGGPVGQWEWAAPDPLVHGFDDDAEALLVSSGNFEDFALAAQTAAESADVAMVAPCPDTNGSSACASSFVQAFATRAYGRPPTAAEAERLTGLYNLAAGDGYAGGVRVVIEAMLMSPHFLYRTEMGRDTTGTPAGGATALTPIELANALSFALTGTRPDAPLLARAQSDPRFSSRDVLRVEARRLAETPAARAHLMDFLRSWLGVRDLRAVNKIPSLFPDFTPGLKVDLDTEMSLLVAHALGEGGGTLDALLGGRATYASGPLLSAIYASDYVDAEKAPAAPAAGAFAETTFNPALRRGVLSLGGWLAAHSPVHRSSPVERGLAVRSRMFCLTPPPPPPDALSMSPGPGDANGTTRQKFEQHSTDPKCAACHRLMDPIGFGMEMMDALGRHRVTEADLPVDSSGMLTGTDVDGPFKGPAELSGKLLQSRQVRDCFVLQMFRYLEGREEKKDDACSLKPLQEFFAPADARIADLAVEMVLRGNFAQRSYEP
ncbi:MAG: DUF1588 domain-containing protein [Pseudomonadota bacterium]